LEKINARLNASRTGGISAIARIKSAWKMTDPPSSLEILGQKGSALTSKSSNRPLVVSPNLSITERFRRLPSQESCEAQNSSHKFNSRPLIDACQTKAM